MSIKTIQKRIKNLVVLGILSTGAVLAGTGCDLDNLATKGLLDSARKAGAPYMDIYVDAAGTAYIDLVDDTISVESTYDEVE